MSDYTELKHIDLTTVPKALRYLANYDRPSGGSDLYNGEHLLQLADEIEVIAAKKLYAAPVAKQDDASNPYPFLAEKLAIKFCEQRGIVEKSTNRAIVVDAFTSGYRLARPVAKQQVVMPAEVFLGDASRLGVSFEKRESFCAGAKFMRTEFVRLNAADQEGAQDE